ncbi:hypothetical protein EFS28_06375 [Lactobacillus acidophilus]|uniref:hypothetical protein n=1 Tax=Lactobacillus acidophilus TaxID=1579 RepID=UPI0021A45A0B|nr:hypothetical protein [Lactobacillus acidophilus]MCT3602659.1 hypothetical protein [Lactobacillus acidophilus]MCT3623849.1 hypothetical protein [Lactobacillus acidophilus]
MEEIDVNFQAKNPSGIKLLNRLYDGHLVLNDIGVRLDEQLRNEEELTVPTQEDVNNLSDTFGKMVDTFTDITDAYGDVNNFADNFAGATQSFAEALITELIDFNNGIADIGDTEGGLENYDNDKLNDWVNQLMNDIVATNEAFNTLIKE